MHNFAAILTIILLTLPYQGASAAKIYVDSGGNDAWSGQQQHANLDRTDGPLASLSGARDAVRRLKTKGPLSESVHVLLADGRYTLKDTLTFTPEDSGTEKCPIVYEAAPGAASASVGAGARRMPAAGPTRCKGRSTTSLPPVAKIESRTTISTM